MTLASSVAWASTSTEPVARNVAQPAEQLLEDHPDLGAGEVGAQAVVGADPEGQVRVGVAVDAELVGRVEYGFVAVGRLVQEEHAVPATKSTPWYVWSSVTVRMNEITG